jgi:hypothetical protein
MNDAFSSAERRHLTEPDDQCRRHPGLDIDPVDGCDACADDYHDYRNQENP